MSDTGRPGEPEQRRATTRRPAAMPQGAPAGSWNDQHGTGTAPSPAPGAAPGEDDRPAHGGRPAWLLPVAIGAGVLVVVGVVVGVLVNRGSDADAPAPAETVVAELPTPAVAPAARPATTAFASALPTTVLQYALEASQDDAEWLAAGALEAYTETFTDGDGGTLTLRAAQLETPQEATAFLERQMQALPAADGDAAADDAETDDAAADDAETGGAETGDAETGDADLPQTGEVLVGGEPVGTFTVVDAGDGTGVAVWQNGTAVFRLTAPLADVADVYRAYGL